MVHCSVTSSGNVLHLLQPLCTLLVGSGHATALQVIQHMLGIPATHMRDQAAADSDSDEEDLTNRINRLWRPTLQPMVKSYSHASM